MQKWSPTSWLQRSYLQAANYADETQLKKAVDQLSLLPPLVTSSEVKHLKKKLPVQDAEKRLFFKVVIVLNHLMIVALRLLVIS